MRAQALALASSVGIEARGLRGRALARRGRVADQLGVDVGGAEHPAHDQGPGERPAQVGVDGQPGRGRDAEQDGVEELEVGLGGGRLGEGVEVGELVVRPALGALEQAAQRGGQGGHAGARATRGRRTAARPGGPGAARSAGPSGR